jgi:uncharacterized protein YggE
VPAAAIAEQVAPQPPPVVSTKGQAIVKRAPDQAFVSIVAETRASTPAAAQQAAADAMTSVQTALSRASLPRDAVRTAGFSLQPDMEYVNGRGRVRGYIVRNQVEVRVDDLRRLGAVLDAAGSSGATSMSGLRFDLKDRATAERQALREAVADAMARARAMADGAGVVLGPVQRIDDQFQPMPPPMPMMAMRAEGGAAAETPITPGAIEIRADVSVTVLILGGR